MRCCNVICTRFFFKFSYIKMIPSHNIRLSTRIAFNTYIDGDFLRLTVVDVLMRCKRDWLFVKPVLCDNEHVSRTVTNANKIIPFLFFFLLFHFEFYLYFMNAKPPTKRLNTQVLVLLYTFYTAVGFSFTF